MSDTSYEIKLICNNCGHEFCRTVSKGKRVSTEALGTYIVDDLFSIEWQPIRCPNCETQREVRKR